MKLNTISAQASSGKIGSFAQICSRDLRSAYGPHLDVWALSSEYPVFAQLSNSRHNESSRFVRIAVIPTLLAWRFEASEPDR